MIKASRCEFSGMCIHDILESLDLFQPEGVPNVDRPIHSNGQYLLLLRIDEDLFYFAGMGLDAV